MIKQQELTELKELRGLIIRVMSGSVENAELESYNYGDADGNQSVKRRSPKELMEWLNEVDKKIEKLERGNGGGLMTFGTNRYRGL